MDPRNRPRLDDLAVFFNVCWISGSLVPGLELAIEGQEAGAQSQAMARRTRHRGPLGGKPLEPVLRFWGAVSHYLLGGTPKKKPAGAGISELVEAKGWRIAAFGAAPHAAQHDTKSGPPFAPAKLALWFRLVPSYSN